MTTEEKSTQQPPLAHAVQLAAITLREVEWKMPEVQIPAGLPIQVNPSFMVGFGFSAGNATYRVTIMLPGIIQMDDKPTDIFQLKATFQAVFTFPENYQYVESDFKQFGELSVFTMVYPYVRELVGTITSRAGFSGVLLAPIPYGREIVEQGIEDTGTGV